ncbi:hypothetical protein Fmac_021924 [Flemingia macrophylla]|uniref:Uncharacterized protein n=1 Tax=Flemingia macrophylla TaxID=520843 RepID=A0ABD1LY87_9FABA
MEILPPGGSQKSGVDKEYSVRRLEFPNRNSKLCFFHRTYIYYVNIIKFIDSKK